MNKNKRPAYTSIFDRLNKDKREDANDEPGEGVYSQLFPSSSSVFERLGGKSNTEEESQTEFTAKSILKNSPYKNQTVTTLRAPISKVPIASRPIISPSSQKVMLVKKIPAKAATMMADKIEIDKMEVTEPTKSVSFSSEDEVLEYATRRFVPKPRLRISSMNSVKMRLGINNRSAKDEIRQTRKLITFKTESPKKKLLISNKLKSEQIKKSIPIHNRLDLGRRNTKIPDKLISKFGNIRLGSKKEDSGNSVFNRLG